MTSDSRLARATFATDVVKHISTLAGGSILLLATFLGGRPKPLDRGTLTAAVILLLACIVCCSMHLFFFGIRNTLGENQTSGEANSWHTPLSTLIFLTFVLGMFFLTISVIRTL